MQRNVYQPFGHRFSALVAHVFHMSLHPLLYKFERRGCVEDAGAVLKGFAKGSRRIPRLLFLEATSLDSAGWMFFQAWRMLAVRMKK